MPTHNFLPEDGFTGTLVARIWNPKGVGGPSVAVIREDGVYDLSEHVPTMSSLLETDEPVVWVRSWPGQRVGSPDDVLNNSTEARRDSSKPFFLSPCDLQVIKAAVDGSGDEENSSLAPTGGDLFTKAPVLSAVGTGGEVGICADANWSNSEPEVVLAVNSSGYILGAALGNDVSLRDGEGCSALWPGSAKDNNASCAIGPFIRLFDDTFNLDDVRNEVVHLQVTGDDGFVMHNTSTTGPIGRDPRELVQQAMSAHQYPDGFMLFMGTLIAPTQDRDQPGAGFTHHVGDMVHIRSPHLGTLSNCVNLCEQAAPWKFGVCALFSNLAQRGLLVH